jgi:hypothetical protein
MDMPLRHRYQPPEDSDSSQDTLPLDSVCTILTRQSTRGQKERNAFSAEVDSRVLVAEAERLGFAPERIRVLDWDMGKGAYNTTIEQRPALHHWLTELLPSSQSRVVLASQEDRLFRDRTEIQVNRFIEQVARYRGWVVCGARVYNFQREMDKEHFRLACKYGKQYIEFHIKGRLHPAVQRAAMDGRYTGGLFPWGYHVDYTAGSSTYKHYIPYESHVDLVRDCVFGRFSQMSQPTVTELARSWWRDGLVWPFFTAEVDSRQVRLRDGKCQRDEARGGYIFVPRQAQTILTNPVYLGWMTRRGEVARDPVTGQPSVCHEPLVDSDLFWWCYDHILDERPTYAPPRVGRSVSVVHPRRSFARSDGESAFLGQGILCCAQHGKKLSSFEQRDASRGAYHQRYLRCWLSGSEERARLEQQQASCPLVAAHDVEAALTKSFVAHLGFESRDEQALIDAFAKVAQKRVPAGTGEVADLERQITAQQAIFERAKRLAYAAPDLESDVVEDMRQAKRAVAQLEARLSDLRAKTAPSARAHCC